MVEHVAAGLDECAETRVLHEPDKSTADQNGRTYRAFETEQYHNDQDGQGDDEKDIHRHSARRSPFVVEKRERRRPFEKREKGSVEILIFFVRNCK